MPRRHVYLASRVQSTLHHLLVFGLSPCQSGRGIAFCCGCSRWLILLVRAASFRGCLVLESLDLVIHPRFFCEASICTARCRVTSWPRNVGDNAASAITAKSYLRGTLLGHIPRVRPGLGPSGLHGGQVLCGLFELHPRRATRATFQHRSLRPSRPSFKLADYSLSTRPFCPSLSKGP